MTLKTHTFEDLGTGKQVASKYVTDGTAKAWCTTNQSGTQAVVESLNVTSITDPGTGQTQVNLTTDFASTAIGAEVGGGAAGTQVAYKYTAPAVGTLYVGNLNSSFVLADGTHVSISAKGDLA